MIKARGGNVSDKTVLNESVNATILNETENVTVLNEMVNVTVLNEVSKDNATVVNGQVGDGGMSMVGEVLEGKYKITSRLNVSTGEADLYICSDGNGEYVAKIYRRKMAIKEEVTEKLKSIDSPYVAQVFSTNVWNEFPYEILPYYRNGSLEGKTFSYEELKGGIIPALNEGLKVLHDNGIIHKDLKPSNIMLADNGQDVAIIDFGISSIREDGNTVIVTRTGMTPEYSAPETFKNLFLSESDYYSLGITLFELYCGHTPYERMSQDEIEQFVSVQRLPLPSEMEEELKVLINALTYPDITNRKNKANPNRRWGYEEILKWCVGIKQPIPGEIIGATTISGDVKPYKFLGQTYTDKQKLVEALANHWKDGKKQLFRGLLSAYFKDVDAEIAGYCMDAEDEVAKGDEDFIFFKTLYKIDAAMTAFVWKENRFDNIEMLGDKFLESLWTRDSTVYSLMDELLKKGVLSQYVTYMDGDDMRRADAVRAIESNHRAFKRDVKQKFTNYYRLAYMLSGKKVFLKNGIRFQSIQEFTEYLKKELAQSYDAFETICQELMDDNDNLDAQFEGWLLTLGKANEIEQWKSSLQE